MKNIYDNKWRLFDDSQDPVIFNENIVDNIEHSQHFSQNSTNSYLLYYELEANNIVNTHLRNLQVGDFSQLIGQYNQKLLGRLTIVEMENYSSDDDADQSGEVTQSSEVSSMSVSDNSRDGSVVRDVSMFDMAASDIYMEADSAVNEFTSPVTFLTPLETSTPIQKKNTQPRLKKNGKPFKKKNKHMRRCVKRIKYLSKQKDWIQILS